MKSAFMKSKRNLYEIVISPCSNVVLEEIPKASEIKKALSGCPCSDLFVDGFSYKRIDLGIGYEAKTDEEYHHLKRIKSAKLISDRARSLSAEEIISRLLDQRLSAENGVIGFCTEYSRAFRPYRLPSSPALFGVELKQGAKFRFFAKCDRAFEEQKIVLCGAEFSVEKVALFPQASALGVLQSAALCPDPDALEKPAARFRLSFCPEKNCPLIEAGSLIFPSDFEEEIVIE